MAALFAERDRRARQGHDAQLALYRHELGTAANERQGHLQAADTATKRIVELLPGAADAGLSIAEISRLTGYSRPTLYRLLNEARPKYDAAIRFRKWAEILDSATEQLGHAAGRDELAGFAGITVDELCDQLTRLYEHAVARLDSLGPAAVLLVEILPSLPHVEKVVLTHIFSHRMSLEEVARSVDRPVAEVIVWAVLGMLRALPAIDKQAAESAPA
ncbi:MAG TPA: helix-turn-helix domain-containing protein [Solirubrobacterales bacterium]|nr:helix-turn-helix domain-containing protein [Solirubrobacterales bacterium]